MPCEPPPLPPPDPFQPAPWVIVAILLAVAAFEFWALHRGRNTISHWLQRWAKRSRVVRVLAVAGLALLGWHLLW